MNITEKSHVEMVATLIKSGEDTLRPITPIQAVMWHSATGIATEAGELLDAIKKVVIYQKPIDRANVVEELGDLEFYMQALRAICDIARDETLEANISKLFTRYADKKYSDKAAHDRADKAPTASVQNVAVNEELRDRLSNLQHKLNSEQGKG